MPTEPQQRFRGDIQGLRAIAVLVIVLCHAGVPHTRGGYVGVDVFFVVSGFLITSHLAEELLATGRIGLGGFYARRARRILPAAFTVIALTLIAATAMQPPLLLPTTYRDAAAAALYVPNILFARERTDYFRPWEHASLFQHYWSLGLEEQFYLLCPIAMLAAFLLLGRSLRGLVIMLAAVFLMSFSLSIYLTPRIPTWAFYLLPTRAWEFAVGGLLAMAALSGRRWTGARIVGLLAWPGLALIAVAVLLFNDSMPFPGWRAVIPVLGCALVILAGTRRAPSSAQRLLSLPPMLFIGLISYSVYLVHWPLLVLTQDAVGVNRPLPVAVKAVLGAAAIPLGYLMYRWVEKPFRFARFFTAHRARRTLATAIAVSLAVAGTSVAARNGAQARGLNAGFDIAASPLARDPRGTDAVPANLDPSLWNTRENPDSLIYRNGCNLKDGQTVLKPCEFGTNAAAPRIALFGDSHAAQFYPALAPLVDTGDIRLTTLTKSGCRTVTNVTRTTQCTLWRDRAIAMLNADPPDVILVGNLSFAIGDWSQNLRASLDRLPRRSRIIVIADTPYPGSSIPICLSAHPRAANDCSMSRHDVLNDANREAERRLGVEILDVTDYLCNPEYCPPIIGNLLVYRDHSHLAEPMAAALAPVVRTQLLG